MRRTALVLLALLVIFAIAVPVIWVQVAANARAMTATALAREAALGRRWTCAGTSVVGGFPFNLSYDCDDARFEGFVGGHAVKASVKGVHASVFLLWPEHPAAALTSPMLVERDNGVHAAIAWRRFELTTQVVPFAIERGMGTIDDLTATLATDAEPKKTMLEAEAVVLGLQRRPAPGADDMTVEVSAILRNAASPFFDEALPSDGKVDARADATVDQAQALQRGSLSDRLEAWRLAGGRLTINDAHATKGASMMDAKGSLALDVTHMPDGSIDTSMAGIEPLLKRYGIPTGVASFSGLLSSFMGGGDNQSPTAARPGALSLRIRLSEGRVYAGPIRLRTSLRPLY